MSKMGLEVVSFTIKEVRRQRTNTSPTWGGRTWRASSAMGGSSHGGSGSRHRDQTRGNVARLCGIAKAAGGSGARCSRDSLVSEASGKAQRDLDIKKEPLTLRPLRRLRRKADKAYEIETNIQQQQVIMEAVRVQQVGARKRR